MRPTAAARSGQLDALLARAREAEASLRSTPLNVKSAVAIIGAVAEVPYPVSKSALTKVLTGRDGAPFDARQVPTSYGPLRGTDSYDLPKQIDALVDLGYLRADQSM